MYASPPLVPVSAAGTGGTGQKPTTEMMAMDEQHRLEFRRLPMHLVAPVVATSTAVARVVEEEVGTPVASRAQGPCAHTPTTMQATPAARVLAAFEDLVLINLALAQELSRLRESWIVLEAPAISRPRHLKVESLPIDVKASSLREREDVLLQLTSQANGAAP
jgi:hypothetical protein